MDMISSFGFENILTVATQVGKITTCLLYKTILATKRFSIQSAHNDNLADAHIR